MSYRQKLPSWPVFALLVGVLTSCGGGGGSASGPVVQQTPAAPFSTFVSPDAGMGKNAAATVMGGQGALSGVRWTQTGGTSVVLLSDKTQTISFDPPQAGTYSFTVTFKDSKGSAQSQKVTIPVGGTLPATYLTLRASQSVRMGGNVSVRAWPSLAAGDAVQSITWTQVDGPSVQLDTSDSYRALFVAPSVTRDTLIRLRATMHTVNGVTDSDEAMVLVEKYTQAASSNSAAVWAGDHVSRVYPYVSNGPYASVLVNSVYDASLTSANLAPLSRLPFIAQETGGEIPTVEQVMNHVLVSHDWLGQNFENFLSTEDTNGDFRRLLNGVTAIVLGTQVRPSFYYAVTGAIYLDADNFWLTPEERDTVNEAPDYRSDFGADLGFTAPWRYARGDTALFQRFDPRARVTRGVDYLLDESGWLLYHELGHAADFLPPALYGSLDSALSAWGNLQPRYSAYQLTSDTVPAQYPLTSTIMQGLAQVSYQGATATTAQKAYTPAQVGGFFSVDLATDEYNYSTSREDIAMTFEEFMMITRLGIRRDVAFADQITPATTNATWYVRWGQRGRIGEDSIKPRLKLILQDLAPWVDVTDVDALPAPIPMRAGDTWIGNLVLSAPAPGLAQARVVDASPLDPRTLRRHQPMDVKLPPR